MPKAPVRRLNRNLASSPPALLPNYKTPRSSTENEVQSIYLYLDYNGVLNSEGSDGLLWLMEGLDFFDNVDAQNDDVVQKILLSYRPTIDGCCDTLHQLANAAVLNMFHKTVFTAKRRGHFRGEVYTYGYYPSYHPQPRYHKCEPQNYDVYTGGKDAFIAGVHKQQSTRIIFADDKFETLQAVKDCHPYATCILMLGRDKKQWQREAERQKRDQDRRHYHIAHTLNELILIIAAASSVIRQNSNAMQLEVISQNGQIRMDRSEWNGMEWNGQRTQKGMDRSEWFWNF